MNVFDFNWNPKYEEHLFVLGKSNFNAFNWLQNTDKWPNRQIVLYGPQYSGKTHLSKIWSEKNNARILSRYEEYSDMQSAALVIDSIDILKNEQNIMNMFYKTFAFKLPVIWISQKPQNLMDFKLNDLKTRFLSIGSVGIEEPDDDMFRKILLKRCNDFGLELSYDCLEYIVKRVDITYESINRVCLNIHELCLQDQKSPSLGLIQQALFDQGKLH